MYEDEDLQEIHEDIQELDTNISTLRRDLNNMSASVNGTGENVTLNKTAEARFKKLEISGNSTQVKLSGKNKFNKDDTPIFYSFAEKIEIQNGVRSKIITNSQSSKFVYVVYPIVDFENLLGQTVTLSAKISPSAENLGRCALFSCNSSGIPQGMIGSLDETGSITIDISSSLPSAATQIGLVLYGNTNGTANVGDYVDYTDIQLEIGTSVTSFEPYVGGKASPNPDYPQEIENVGDNINLIDYTTVQPTSNTTVELIENGFKATGKYAGMITVTGLKENTDYFLQYVRENITGSQAAVNVYAGTTQSTTLRNMLYPNTFNTGNNTTVNIWFYASMGGDVCESNFTFIKLEEGTTMTPYSPYNTGNAQVLVNNKNLFAYNNISLNSYYEINNNTKQLVKRMNYSGAFCQRTPIPIKAGETIHYYFKNNYSSAVRLYIMITDKNMKYITNYEWGGSIAVNSIVSKSKTLPSNAVYLLYSVLDIADDTDIENSFEIQVEYNNAKTDFIKGNVQSFVFPLAEGQKLMLGDYLADDGIHHVRGQVVLDGNEKDSRAWFYGTELTNTISFGSVKSDINYASSISPISNYFKGKTSGVSSIDEEFVQIAGNIIYCRINKNRLADISTQTNAVNSFKTWVSTHNTIVEYKLQEEVIVPYTSAQQEVYNQIKQAISCDEQTNISGFSTKVSPKFEVKAFRNMNTSIESLQSRIELLKGRS